MNAQVYKFLSFDRNMVSVPPQIQLDPITQVVRPGDNAYITCTATGDQPISIYWSAVGANQLPKSVSVNRGILQVRIINQTEARIHHIRGLVTSSKTLFHDDNAVM